MCDVVLKHSGDTPYPLWTILQLALFSFLLALPIAFILARFRTNNFNILNERIGQWPPCSGRLHATGVYLLQRQSRLRCQCILVPVVLGVRQRT